MIEWNLIFGSPIASVAIEGVHIPAGDREQFDYKHLLYSLDFLIEYKENWNTNWQGR